jgi:hypothetical protein
LWLTLKAKGGGRKRGEGRRGREGREREGRGINNI